jgi:hypothetical protein
MENVALGVLGIIIIANVVAIVAVLIVGGKHDEHHEVRDEKEAKSLARLKELYDFPERAAQNTQPVVETKPASAIDASHTEQMADQLAEAVAQLPEEDKKA